MKSKRAEVTLVREQSRAALSYNKLGDIGASFMKTTLVFTLLAASLLSYASNAVADKTILAGGCFWCMESDFEKLEGVTDVISGFTGGTLKDPTYNGNHTGHYEAVEITYDPSKVSYEELLDYFWINIDPFDASGQFCDKGSSYLSAIFTANQEEREIAEQTKMTVEKKFPNNKIIYPIKGSESYHQDYYKKSPVRYRLYRWNCGRDSRLAELWGN